jgi:hypothetical protein
MLVQSPEEEVRMDVLNQEESKMNARMTWKNVKETQEACDLLADYRELLVTLPDAQKKHEQTLNRLARLIHAFRDELERA